MIRHAILLLMVPFLLHAEEWTTHKTGPFEVYTDRNPSQARAVLNHVEQLRWAFSYFTGKQDPVALWPVRIVVSNKATSAKLVQISDGWRGFLREKDDIPIEWNAQIMRILIDDNLGRMPGEIEQGFIDVLSTTEVSGTHIIIGQPPKPLTLDWARMHYLMTSEEYRARVRVILANLNKGVDLDASLRNAMSKTLAQINQAAQSHLNATAVVTFDLPGKPLNAARDFTTRYPERLAIARATSDQNAPATAMALFAEGKFEEASKVNPLWERPFYELSKREADAGKKAGFLKRAAELSPRDAKLWTEFATLMMEYNRWIDADKAWAQAQRAAADAGERKAIQARRSQMIELRAEAEAQAKREAKLAEERAIQQLKNEAVARIRKAENEANTGTASTASTDKIEKWWDAPKGDSTLSGTLNRVDCLAAGKLRLAVSSQGKTTVLRVTNPAQFTIEGSPQATLACGTQKPVRKVEVEYNRSQSEALVIRFQ